MNNKDVRSFCAMASTMFRYYNACDGITNVFLNCFTGQDSPGGKVVLEGKCRAKCATDVHELSQCFATAITFSSIQQRRHPTVHCFPTIRISPRGFDIILYNPEFDLLLICCMFRLDKKGIVNSVNCRTLPPISCNASIFERKQDASPVLRALDPWRRSAQVGAGQDDRGLWGREYVSVTNLKWRKLTYWRLFWQPGKTSIS